MCIIFVYNSKCALTTLNKVLNNGGLTLTIIPAESEIKFFCSVPVTRPHASLISSPT